MGTGSQMVGRWEQIGPPDCPLMFRRTIVAGRLGKLLIHRFVPAATDKDPHDHPRAFVTIVLRGGYDDVQPCAGCLGDGRGGDYLGMPCEDCWGSGVARVDRVRAPTIRYRSASHAHITNVHDDGALTVVIMGWLVRDWGFVREGRWWPWRWYERKFGLGFRCEDD